MVEADNMIKNNINVLKLNIGNPATFGFKAPDNLINKIFKNMDKAQGYSVSQGIYEARIEIKKYCNSKNISNIDINDIYLGNGVSELILMSMQGLLNKGDEILIPSPDYPLWTAAATLAGGNVVHYKCEELLDWNPDTDDIKRKITSRTKAIVIINPNNPTGALYSRDVLNEIVDIARKKIIY